MREKLFQFLTKRVTAHPWSILGIALLLSVASVVLFEVKQVKFETRVLDLLPKEDVAAVAFNDILKQYDSASQIIIGVKGGSKSDKIAFIDKVGTALENVNYKSSADGKRYPYVKHTVLKMETDFLANHGLMLTKRQNLEKFESLFAELEMADLLTAYNDFLEMEYIEDTAAVTEREKEDGAINNLKAIVQWLQGVNLATPSEQGEHAQLAVDGMTMGEQYMFSQDDTMLIGMVVPTVSMDQMEESMGGAKNLRKAVSTIQKEFPDLEVRLTGMPMLSLEEMEVTEQDMGASTLISLVLVLALFIVAFRMWTAPLLATVNLMIGIVWTLAVIALFFGRLNLMTTMFAVILIGLGIDFAIHLNAAYATARGQSNNMVDVILGMYQNCGRGVITGALTTSTAFFVLAFTGVDAFVELGVILAAGILLTVLSSLVVLPAMYVVTERGRRKIFKNNAHLNTIISFPFLARAGKLMTKKTVALAIVFVFAGATGFWAYKSADAAFESNMLEIEPPDMPSVLLHKEVLRLFEINPDFAMLSVSSVEESRKIAERMKQNRLVGRVDSISEYLPSIKEQQRRIPVMKAIARQARSFLEPDLASGLPHGSAITGFPEYMLKEAVTQEETKQIIKELDRLNMNIKEIGQMAFFSMKDRLATLCNRLSGGQDNSFSVILDLQKRFEKETRLGAQVAAYQRVYIPLLAERLMGMANTDMVSMEILPSTIAERYLSKNGENLVTIYSAVDLWDGNKMELFNKATAKVSERITGTVVLMDRLISLIGERGILATLFSLGAVFIILLIDFRSIVYAVLGLLPVVCGFIWMIGIFTFFKLEFDVANVTAIPLILGIGIDDAVHILHGIKRNGVAKLPHILKGTGRALILTSLTTAIAFGAIAFSSHRGLAGMGILLTLGVLSCLLASVWLLPSVARLVLRKTSTKWSVNNVSKEVSQ